MHLIVSTRKCSWKCAFIIIFSGLRFGSCDSVVNSFLSTNCWWRATRHLVMADSTVSARREARKRRILQNSESRLKRITGQDESILNDTPQSEGMPNGPINPFEGIKNGPFCNIPVVTKNYTPHAADVCCDNPADNYLTKDEYESESVLEVIETFDSKGEEITRTPEEEEQSKPTLLQSLLNARVHFVCLAILVRMLYGIDCGFLFGESIFGPLCILELTDLLVLNLSGSKASSGLTYLLGAFLLLSGVQASRVAAFTNAIRVLSKLGKDISAYLVSFIIFHAILEWPG